MPCQVLPCPFALALCHFWLMNPEGLEAWVFLDCLDCLDCLIFTMMVEVDRSPSILSTFLPVAAAQPSSNINPINDGLLSPNILLVEVTDLVYVQATTQGGGGMLSRSQPGYHGNNNSSSTSPWLLSQSWRQSPSTSCRHIEIQYNEIYDWAYG
ncbi:uncharacterized protein BO66DRAFT_403468 [Aspergillus aculeatinus CBS 121060]|uniref:Uncharacterized protein n=1 Tax=Aspergillus aculeatinus CBS 121060 TaxID=1448322 RepID=A0ACD1H1X4_9EURO|nr:hypothetical protein BO66DRAFT_403468 [Aspergillus aculeatinus CBS 121060]RAH67757.1 hypothetical protein BO66DRAFT_403468 [Aspergillus aculeatinus CBS 121060]